MPPLNYDEVRIALKQRVYSLLSVCSGLEQRTLQRIMDRKKQLWEAIKMNSEDIMYDDKFGNFGLEGSATTHAVL